MATTTLISIHKLKEKTAEQTIKDSLEYIMNPYKTQHGKYVTCYGCEAETAVAEFSLSKRIYHDITGRKQRNNVVMYQIRQSFKPDEVTPEQAQQIAYDLAMSFTKGKYAFVAATHIDKDHIHTHIDFNSTSLECNKKFRNFLKSGRALAKISDKLCLENGLSIIENPKKSDTKYETWLGEKPLTFSDKLRIAIDEVLLQKPKSFDEFLKLMQDKGFEVSNRKLVGFKSAEQGKFIRLRSLGEDYSEEKIKSVIAGETVHNPKPKAKPKRQQKVNLLVDIQEKINEGKGAGYEQWAKVYNLKQMAQTINFLQENKLMEYEKLEQKAKEITNHFDELNETIKSTEQRMQANKILQNHIFNYNKTHKVFIAYKNSGYSKKFEAEHETALILHKAARQAFNELEVKPIPKISELEAEYAELFSTKKQAYSEFKNARKQMQDVLRAKQNFELILGLNKEQNIKKKAKALI